MQPHTNMHEAWEHANGFLLLCNINIPDGLLTHVRTDMYSIYNA